MYINKKRLLGFCKLPAAAGAKNTDLPVWRLAGKEQMAIQIKIGRKELEAVQRKHRSHPPNNIPDSVTT